MAERRGCPVGCGRTVAPGKLLCYLCWREVPAHLQRDVYATFRTWRSDVGDADKFTAYKAAADAAIGSIR